MSNRYQIVYLSFFIEWMKFWRKWNLLFHWIHATFYSFQHSHQGALLGRHHISLIKWWVPKSSHGQLCHHTVYVCCRILWMPIAQPPLAYHFHHINNTLQNPSSLSDLFPMSRQLITCKHAADIWCALRFSCSSVRWCTCLQSDIPVINVLESPILPKAIHTKQNNAWRVSQYVSHLLLVPFLQVNTLCTTGFLAFCCGWWSKKFCSIEGSVGRAK